MNDSTFLLNTTFYAMERESGDANTFAIEIAMGIMTALLFCCLCMNQQRELIRWRNFRDMSTLSCTERIEYERIGRMVIEHWIRIIYGCSEDFVFDLVLLMADFTKFPEQFDAKLSDSEITISSNLHRAGYFNLQDEPQTSIGEYIAEPGGKYVWKLKLIYGVNVGIGVINSAKCHKHHTWWWIWRNQGCVWFIKTKLFQPNDSLYGVECSSGDIVDMELNLVECTLSYKVNDRKIGIATDKIAKNEGYRLAIVFPVTDNSNTVEIISLVTR
eukprot:8030_1